MLAHSRAFAFVVLKVTKMKFPTFQAGRDNSKRYDNKSVSSTISLFLHVLFVIVSRCKDTISFLFDQMAILFFIHHGDSDSKKIR
jgi:hypothetical protein